MSDDGTTAIQIAVQTATGTRRGLARAVTAVPGLCVHQYLWTGKVPGGSGGWIVTHINTGRSVDWGRWHSKEVVLGLAVALGKLGDWTFATAADCPISKQDIRGVIGEYQDGHPGQYTHTP